MTESKDDNPAHDPNENTIFKVCSASELEKLTTDGWKMVHSLETPGVHVTQPESAAGIFNDSIISNVHFYQVQFLLSRTRDVSNLERAETAERSANEAEQAKARAVDLTTYSMLRTLLDKLGTDKIEELIGRKFDIPISG